MQFQFQKARLRAPIVSFRLSINLISIPKSPIESPHYNLIFTAPYSFQFQKVRLRAPLLHTPKTLNDISIPKSPIESLKFTAKRSLLCVFQFQKVRLRVLKQNEAFQRLFHFNSKKSDWEIAGNEGF